MAKNTYKMTLRVVIEKNFDVEAESYDDAVSQVEDEFNNSSLGDYENEWVDENIYEG